MAYTQYTFADLIALISEAMQDPANVYWSVAEVQSAIKESMLLYGALTTYWTDPANFNTAVNTPFYDLSVQLPTLRKRTITLGQLTGEIQQHFLEPASGVSGAGMTQQFDIQQITAALTRSRNEFVLDARLPFQVGEFTVTSTGLTWDEASQSWDEETSAWDALGAISGPIDLDQSIALIQRAAWRGDGTAVWSTLRREDAWSAQSYNPLWNLTPGVPFAYSQAEVAPGEFQFIPPPAGGGTLQLVYVATIDMAVEDGTLLRVPDEFAMAIKYKAMYETLSTDNKGYDYVRARYCLERYKAIVEAARGHRSVLRIRVNNRPVPLDVLSNLDGLRPKWLNQFGRPDYAACAFDFLALSKVPNGVYAITADVSSTAHLPVLLTDPIDLGREELPYIIDYCRHLLSFKMGGQEFLSTLPLYDNFLAGAAQRNKLLADKARYLTPLFAQPLKEQEIVPAA